MTHSVFTYAIPIEQRIIPFIQWKHIDPSAWPSGRYFIGIVAADEYGYSGLAAMARDAALSSNPLLVYVATGK